MAEHQDICDQVQSVESFSYESCKQMWKNIGDDAEEIAELLEEALATLLDPNSGGWSGPASEAFEEEVTKIIEFARDISDSLASTGADTSQFNVFADAVETIRDYQDRNRDNGNSKGRPSNLSEEAERNLPPAPWWIDGRIKIYHAYDNMMGWGGSWDNQTDHEYFAYDTWKAGDHGNTDGESDARNGIVSTSPQVVEGNGPWEQLLSNYGEYEGVDGSETVLPKEPFDWDAFFEMWLAGYPQLQTCRTTLTDLTTYLGGIQYATPPEIPHFEFVPQDAGGTGMGGDIGAGGDYGGDYGDMGDAGGGSHDPDLPDGQGDPSGPYDPDGPTQPQDPNGPGGYDPDTPTGPFDPNGPGGPGGGGWDGSSYDPNNPGGGGTDLSRAGAGAGGAMGGGFGGGGPGAGSGVIAGPGSGMAGSGMAAAPAAAGGGLGAGTAGGMGMAPMMGGGAGQQGQGDETERNTWLDEDEDIWGADFDGAPPVIGGTL